MAFEYRANMELMVCYFRRKFLPEFDEAMFGPLSYQTYSLNFEEQEDFICMNCMGGPL